MGEIKQQESLKTLSQTMGFRLAIGVPLFLATLMAAAIIYNESKLVFCFSANCFDVAYKLFRYPVVVAGASVPLVAIVAAIHRSKQMFLQISYSSRQFDEVLKNNRFGNYFKHRETFDKLLDSYCGRKHYENNCKTFNYSYAVYSRLFPDASYDDVSWHGQYSEEYLNKLEGFASVIVFEYKKSDGEFDVVRFLSALRSLLNAFGLNYSVNSLVKFNSNGNKLSFSGPKRPDLNMTIVHAARDSLAMVAIVRGFLGLGLNQQLSVNILHEEALRKLSLNKAKYSVG